MKVFAILLGLLIVPLQVCAVGHCIEKEMLYRPGSVNSLIVIAEAAQRTGFPLSILLAVLEQETGSGRNTGIEGGAIIAGKPSRDGDLAWVLATRFKRDPRTTCASRRAQFGWGGAMGVMQVTPSTFAEQNGWRVNRGSMFSAKMQRGQLVTTSRDISILQWHLQREGYRITRDGVWGKQTRKALTSLQHRLGFQKTACAKEIGRLGGCTRSYIAATENLTTVSYDGRRDKVRRFFGESKPLDPWSVKGSVFTGAYYLRKMYDLGVKRHGKKWALQFALGAYFAGPGGAWKRGQGYARSVLKIAKRKRAGLVAKQGALSAQFRRVGLNPTY